MNSTEYSSISYFDYTSDATNALLKINEKKTPCSKNLLEQSINKSTIDYKLCLQYFNTLPVQNCIDNIPIPYNIVIEE